ncbi:MAG: DNA mismatch endonuclease Vsr [Bacteroidales bacterium]|nr:DNA mismatch endonuclease Vsr [Bacteroidales bacterium]
MTDHFTPIQRHLVMSHIRSRNTKPELKVRKWLWSHGYRYRLNVKGVPGKPDIVMRRYRTAIFVNGCFWHGHEGCEKFKMPKTNVEFWEAKIRRNRERDCQNYQILKENGWQVLVLWECELTKKSFEATMQKVEVMLHDYCLKTISPKVKEYIRVDEDAIQMAAEAEADYGD